MKPRRFAGLSLLLAGAIIVVGYQFVWNPNPPKPKPPSSVTVSGIIGGKVGFFEDADIAGILKERYGLTVKYQRVGSIDQIKQCKAPHDFCWPSSQTAGEVIKQNLGASVHKDAIIFNSPIVLYTWTRVSDALIANGIVKQSGDTYFVTDFPKLVRMISEGQPWSALGLPQLYGKIAILSSDPAKSNTGNTYSALLANTLNGGQVVDAASVETVLPQLRIFFHGLLLGTSTAVFEQFLNLGMGAAPIIVGYESALIEHGLANPAQQPFVRQEVRTLYPQPTIWSSQPLLALTEGGTRLLAALRDPAVQRLGWEHHGFRSGDPGVRNDPAAVPALGVPATIDSVIAMPEPRVIERIISSLSATPITALESGESSSSVATRRSWAGRTKVF